MLILAVALELVTCDNHVLETTKVVTVLSVAPLTRGRGLNPPQMGFSSSIFAR